MALKMTSAQNQHERCTLQPTVASAQISLVGRNMFQNQLLKTALEAEFAAAVHVDLLQEWPMGEVAQKLESALLLWDCYGSYAKEIWLRLGAGGSPDATHIPIAFFNADPDLGTTFERQALERKIRGVFYLDENPQNFLKGVSKILQGELWFSRKTTSDILLDMHFRSSSLAVAEAMLTHREKEILIAIASGATNTEIASEINVSPHTVKTHLYNIYKKIDVKNRLEATLWVARYL